jgi:hypothetical protein
MDFNRNVADWVYGLVSKMDDGEARMFTVFLAEDLYQTDLKNNAKLVERTRASVEKAMTDELANDFLFRLERGVNPEQLVAEAAAVAIAKADDYEAWKFQTREHGRWAKMGPGYWKAQKKAIKAEGDYAKQAAMMSAMRFHHGDQIKAMGEDLGPQVHGVQQQWNKRSTGQSGATDTFNRITAAGRTTALVGVATDQPNVYAAGQAASLVGQFGPEAEKVVGPAVRRTAYRYRGTETKPQTKEIKAAANNRARELFPTERDKKGVPTGQGMAPLADLKSGAARPENVDRLDESKRDFVLQMGAADHLATKIPSLALANLQVKSGKIPPSEGVIINGDGQVTAQAVGFAEDHYLPFNLRNLGELNGGRYVRTRTTGGPTSEDIHAATLAGARSFTVVSRSGEFTVDFADDFRGARRHSDKAMGMQKQYEQLLDAVKSKQVEKLPTSARERAEVREELEDEIERLKSDPASGFDYQTYTDKMFNEELNRRLTQRRQNPKLTSEEITRIDEFAWNGLNRQAPTDREKVEHDKAVKQLSRRVLREKGNQNFKLDGDGYKAALEALKEQYPYFIADIRVRSAGDAPEDFGDGTDQGYVKPRHIRAEAAQAGYFGVGIEGATSTKRSAENLHYQNWGVRQNMKTAAPQGTEQTEEERDTNPSTIPATPQPGQTPAVTAVGGGGATSTATSPQEHAQAGERASRVQTAEIERDNSVYQAAHYWADRLPPKDSPSYAYIPAEAKILDELRDASDPKSFTDRNREAIKRAVAHISAAPESRTALAGAPKIVDNVEEVKRAVAANRPVSLTPQPLTQDDMRILHERGLIKHTAILGGGTLQDEGPDTKDLSDDRLRQKIMAWQGQHDRETSPVERAKIRENQLDYNRLLAFRKHKLERGRANNTPFSPAGGPPPTTTPPPTGSLPPGAGSNTYNPNSNVRDFRRRSA